MPDKSHNWSNHAGQVQKVTGRQNCCWSHCNPQQRENAIHEIDDGDRTLFGNVAQPKAYNKIHQQRYAAKVHPTEVEAAKESAAM